MKKLLAILLSAVMLLSLVACGEEIVPKSADDNDTNVPLDTTKKVEEENIIYSYAEFLPNIIEVDKTQTTLFYEVVDAKEQLDAFVVRYQERIDEDYALYEGIEAVLAQTKAYQETANAIFAKFDAAFFEENVLFLIGLPTISLTRDLSVDVRTVKNELCIDVIIANQEGTADESMIHSTVAVWVDREVVQKCSKDIVVTKKHA